MEFQPYSPIEEALQESKTLAPPIKEKNYNFLWGVLAATGTGALIFWIISIYKSQVAKSTKEDSI